MVKDDPLKAMELLKKNSNKFSESKSKEIKKNIIKRINEYGKEFLTRQTFKGEYANFDEPSDSNGYTLLDIEKLETIISYLAQSMSYFYKVKLMKSLWYSDVLYYKKTGKSMTGLVYRHDRMGALPVGHYSLMNLEKLNVCEEISQNDNSMLHVYPCLNVDYSILTKEEKSVLDDVINKFKDFKASEIVDYMHEEMAYRETKDGEIIPFSLAKNIREFSLTN